jgi:uncharacterized lipoprotein NlpE involved in copper resistance
MKKILLLSALSFALAACGTLPSQVVSLPAPVTTGQPSTLTLLTDQAQLTHAGLRVTLEGQALIVAPTGSVATVRIGGRVQLLTGPLAVRPSSGLIVEGQVEGSFTRVASLR